MSLEQFRRNATALAFGLAAGGSLVMAACSEPRGGDSDVTAETSAPTELIDTIDTVDDLTLDPERLAVVQEGCRTNQPWATEQPCRAAAETRRRRFRGEGVPYTPWPVLPYPVQPMPEASTPPPAKRTPQEPAAIPPSGSNL